MDDVIKPSPGIVSNNNKKPEKKEDVIIEEDEDDEDEDDEDEEVLPGSGPIKGYAPPNVVKPSTTVRIPIVARPSGSRPQWSPPPRIPTSTWIPSRSTTSTTTTTTTTTTTGKYRKRTMVSMATGAKAVLRGLERYLAIFWRVNKNAEL